MKNHLILALVLASCGDDGGKAHDAAIDAPAAFPAAPTLNAQIDRLGRPAINTALNAPFVTGAAKTAQRDAYNAVTDPAQFATAEVATGKSVVKEFAANLALYDALDRGTSQVGAGCGNSALYTAPPSATSYTQLATVLADDRLYVDTAKTSCNLYLSLELEVATGGAVPHSECGGRAPSHDVIDTSFSLLWSGINGFNSTTLEPIFHDDVDAHTDISDTAFPFLGAPH